MSLVREGFKTVEWKPQKREQVITSPRQKDLRLENNNNV